MAYRINNPTKSLKYLYLQQSVVGGKHIHTHAQRGRRRRTHDIALGTISPRARVRLNDSSRRYFWILLSTAENKLQKTLSLNLEKSETRIPKYLLF